MARETYENDEDNNTEYQFTDDQDNLNYDYQEKSPEAPPKRASKKRPVLIVIIALIAIYVIYKIVTMLFVPDNVAPTVKSVVKPPVFVQPTKPAVAQVIPKQQPVKAMPSSLLGQQQANQLQQSQTQMTQQMNALQQTSKSLADRVEKQQFQAQTTTMALQESIDNVNRKLSQISSSVSGLTAANAADLAKARQRALAKGKAHQRAERAIRLKKRYVVDAVIPGRAWLKGADGTTVTVSVGEHLPGYGTIVKINPYSGQVVTNRGIIPYSTD
jgi:intracellular multiplication protein IcmG